jgi:hypothetical protein
MHHRSSYIAEALFPIICFGIVFTVFLLLNGVKFQEIVSCCFPSGGFCCERRKQWLGLRGKLMCVIVGTGGLWLVGQLYSLQIGVSRHLTGSDAAASFFIQLGVRYDCSLETKTIHISRSYNEADSITACATHCLDKPHDCTGWTLTDTVEEGKTCTLKGFVPACFPVTHTGSTSGVLTKHMSKLRLILGNSPQAGASNHPFHALDALLQTKPARGQPIAQVRKLIFETYSEEWAYSRDHRLVWFVQRPHFRQSDRIETLLRLLVILDTFMRGAGVQYWLDSGTLLGARRSKNIMAWDEDADIGILDESLPKLLTAIERTPPMCDDCTFVIRHNYERQAVVAKFVNTTSGFYVDVIQFKLQVNEEAVQIAALIGEGDKKEAEKKIGGIRGGGKADAETKAGMGGEAEGIQEQQGLPPKKVLHHVRPLYLTNHIRPLYLTKHLRRITFIRHADPSMQCTPLHCLHRHHSQFCIQFFAVCGVGMARFNRWKQLELRDSLSRVYGCWLGRIVAQTNSGKAKDATLLVGVGCLFSTCRVRIGGAHVFLPRY